MSVTLPVSEAIFEGGPFPHIQKSLGLFRPVGRHTPVRTVLVIAIVWFPSLSPLPFEFRTVLGSIVSALLPFIAVVLMTVPLILKEIAKLLF